MLGEDRRRRASRRQSPRACGSRPARADVRLRGDRARADSASRAPRRGRPSATIDRCRPLMPPPPTRGRSRREQQPRPRRRGTCSGNHTSASTASAATPPHASGRSSRIGHAHERDRPSVHTAHASAIETGHALFRRDRQRFVVRRRQHDLMLLGEERDASSRELETRVRERRAKRALADTGDGCRASIAHAARQPSRRPVSTPLTSPRASCDAFSMTRARSGVAAATAAAAMRDRGGSSHERARRPRPAQPPDGGADGQRADRGERRRQDQRADHDDQRHGEQRAPSRRDRPRRIEADEQRQHQQPGDVAGIADRRRDPQPRRRRLTCSQSSVPNQPLN